jgi:CheY-like chemotaxis protein
MRLPVVSRMGDAVPRRLLEGRSILLVEDVFVPRTELKTALEEAGAEVACADVARAVVYVERPFLSAVVLDCLPGSLERRAIIRRLRELRLPFLIYSAEPPGTVTTGQGAPFVRKPSPPEVLIAALAAWRHGMRDVVTERQSPSRVHKRVVRRGSYRMRVGVLPLARRTFPCCASPLDAGSVVDVLARLVN